VKKLFSIAEKLKQVYCLHRYLRATTRFLRPAAPVMLRGHAALSGRWQLLGGARREWGGHGCVYLLRGIKTGGRRKSTSVFTMQSLPDLRGQSITDWEQEVTMSIPFGRGDPIKVVIAPGLVVPRTMFKYQLQQAIYEGSANGGVRWWCKKVAEPCGTIRQAKFDISVRFGNKCAFCYFSRIRKSLLAKPLNLCFVPEHTLNLPQP
jgi:hypothetical protein